MALHCGSGAWLTIAVWAAGGNRTSHRGAGTECKGGVPALCALDAGPTDRGAAVLQHPLFLQSPGVSRAAGDDFSARLVPGV